MSDDVYLVENYITNIDEIINLLEKYKDKFTVREPGHANNFQTKYGSSKFKSLFYTDTPDDLKEAVFRTMPEEVLFMPPDEYCFNIYEPGSYLRRHTDVGGKFYKFDLIFLQSDKPHLKYYTKDLPEGALVQEMPGALCRMPIEMEHEVTEIGSDERPKISFVMSWKI
jgi:hypothetical protein